ncbi:MAG: amine oxidase [Acidobacteria bacterium]|nr:MAG: amine oxidase [Acidobacteriota bacterium]REJ98227.1 MAG: amine oxidase [Acidobacteriota bacterium]REK16971.1 MAG: amine oxidase [Acidobacteriota bacterium]REK42881.1 MAG: amine oxidase [Acidobacteriota bacterium]
MKTRVDVIGAGISGLASAYFLAKSDIPFEIHVWEKDASPGGLAGTFSNGDFTIEKFYHHFYLRDVALTELINELGMGDDLIWRPGSTGSYYQQQPYRLSSPVDLLKYKPLGIIDRFRLGWMILHARRHKDWHELDDTSVRDYVTRVAGERVYRTVWEPLFRGKFGKYADSISAAWLWCKLIDRGTSQSKSGRELLGYLRGGLGRIFNTMVEFLESRGHQVHFGRGIKKLKSDADGRIGSIVTDEGEFDTDFVVSGVQLPDLARILPDSLDSYKKTIGEIKFLGNVCLILTLKRSLSDFYWTNISDVSFPFIGIIEQTKWASPDDYAGKHIVYISSYIGQDDPRMKMDATELLDSYLPYIRKMFPEFSIGDVLEKFAWRAPYAQPICEVGYRDMRPGITTPAENLYVCTMAQIYPHDRQVSNGVEMARKVSGMVVERFSEESES